MVDRFGDAAWINGGSPTEGFLKFGADGPFKGFYNDIAGDAWADWLFMLGLLGIGLALILGIAMRIAAAAGALLLVLMWTVVLPPENNPFMDDHLIYALVLVRARPHRAPASTLGFGRFWERMPMVATAPSSSRSKEPLQPDAGRNPDGFRPRRDPGSARASSR